MKQICPLAFIQDAIRGAILPWQKLPLCTNWETKLASLMGAVCSLEIPGGRKKYISKKRQKKNIRLGVGDDFT